MEATVMPSDVTRVAFPRTDQLLRTAASAGAGRTCDHLADGDVGFLCGAHPHLGRLCETCSVEHLNTTTHQPVCPDCGRRTSLIAELAGLYYAIPVNGQGDDDTLAVGVHPCLHCETA